MNLFASELPLQDLNLPNLIQADLNSTDYSLLLLYRWKRYFGQPKILWRHTLLTNCTTKVVRPFPTERSLPDEMP